MKHSYLNTRLTAFALSSLLILSCGKKEKDEAKQEEDERARVLANGNSASVSKDPSVPQVGAVNLAGLGDSGSNTALNLADANNRCDDGPDLGIFGLAIGGACHTSGFAAKIMVGSEDGDNNDDGVLDCADFTEGTNSGIVLGLMCGDFFKRFDGIKAFSFENKEEGEILGLSFADYAADDNVAAVGSWTKGNSASYPANIRIWGGTTSFESMVGVFAANLLSLDEGEVQVDFENKETAEHFRISSAFKNNLGTKTNCEADPSESNCVFQSVKIYNPDDTSTDGAPNGMHLRIMADDKLNPTFYLIEGRYSYSDAKAAGFAQHGLESTREIYFQTIQRGDQIWGQFEFRGPSGTVITLPGQIGAVLTALKLGVCKNTVDGADVVCSDIDATQFDGLWVGRDQMDAVSASPVTADFVAGKPTKSELCLTDFKTCIDLSAK